MGEVQDLPASDGEEEDEDDEDEDEDEDEEADVDGEDAPEAESSDSAPVDEETARKQIADRLEAIRLNKALGNDDPSDAHGDLDPEAQHEDDASSESDSDSSDALSDGPPASDFTAYTRDPKPRPERMTKKQLGQSSRKTDLRHAIAHKVGKERDLQLRLSGQASGATGGGAKAGKAKGHKWKSNPAYLVGKAGGGDGW